MVCMGLAAVPLLAAEPLGITKLESCLKAMPAAELPAGAAVLVKNSSPAERIAIATNVVKTAVQINPAAATLIVGAVARAVPETAALCAGAAAAGQPGQTEEITRTAVAVVPAQAGHIVVAVCRATPDEYKQIAITAARVAPVAARDILKAVGTVKPELRPYIDMEMALHTRDIPSVTWCLDQAEDARSRATAAANRKDSRSGTPSKLKPPHGNGKPPGGRNYARP